MIETHKKDSGFQQLEKTMFIGVGCEWMFRKSQFSLAIAMMTVIVKVITIFTATCIGADSVGTDMTTPSSVLSTLIDVYRG